MVGVIGLVGQDVGGGEPRDQGFGLSDVVALAAGEDEAHRVAQGVDSHVQLGGQTASASANGAIFRPPFLPAACWCARTMVESTITYSKSGSSAKALKRLHQTPSRPDPVARPAREADEDAV